MKRAAIAILVLSIVFFLAFVVSAHDGEQQSETYPGILPEFSLKDPAGNLFSSRVLSENGMVLVVTAPIQRNKNIQNEWDEALRKNRGKCPAKIVFLEDMAPSSFKGIALSKMKKDYAPGIEPILLIDNNGKVRESLNVKKKGTVVLVYDKSFRLIHVEAGPPGDEAAQKIWRLLKCPAPVS